MAIDFEISVATNQNGLNSAAVVFLENLYVSVAHRDEQIPIVMNDVEVEIRRRLRIPSMLLMHTFIEILHPTMEIITSDQKVVVNPLEATSSSIRTTSLLLASYLMLIKGHTVDVLLSIYMRIATCVLPLNSFSSFEHRDAEYFLLVRFQKNLFYPARGFTQHVCKKY